MIQAWDKWLVSPSRRMVPRLSVVDRLRTTRPGRSKCGMVSACLPPRRSHRSNHLFSLVCSGIPGARGGEIEGTRRLCRVCGLLARWNKGRLRVIRDVHYTVGSLVCSGLPGDHGGEAERTRQADLQCRLLARRVFVTSMESPLFVDWLPARRVFLTSIEIFLWYLF